MTEKRREEFKHPGIKYRSRPFWAWNGELSEQELYRQMDVMKEMGFGGAFIHSRVGLETEYMGQEWMQLVDKCLAYGKKIGLELWIYDEDRWPSGSAGGAVTKKKKNRTRRIQMSILSGEEVELLLQQEKENQKDNEEIIAAYQCDLEGHSYRNLRPYTCPKAKTTIATDDPDASDASDASDADCSEKILIFAIRESASSDNYNGYTYLDTMNREAVEDFLEATHDRYETELSKEGLTSLQGFFTDEPHRGAYLCDFSEGNVQSVPYTEGLFEKFKEKYGYDLKETLPSLFLREQGQECSGTSLDYLELTQDLFLESYMEPYREKCHAYGYLFTGHLLHEDSLSTQTCMMGSLMTGYEYMDIPGIDLLGERTDCWWIGKQLSSVAHQLGRKKMLSELYGCTGWQMKLEDYKAVGDWQAMMGINLFCPHLCWYTMKGENKRDYPASIFYQSAWYKGYSYLEDYFARVHMCTEGKPADCRLLVINPIRSVWARTYSGCFQWLLSNDSGIDRIEKQYGDTFRFLMEAGVDFDYGEERILHRHGKVLDGKLLIGECAYDKVLLSGVETIEESTWQLLMELTRQGGKVIVAGREPFMIRAAKDPRIQELVTKSQQIPFEKVALMRAVHPSEPLYELENYGKPVYLQAYEREGEISFILLNMDREHAAEAVLRIYREGTLEEWNAQTGDICVIEAERGNGMQELAFSFAPGEEKIIVLFPFTQKVTRETTDNITNNQTEFGATPSNGRKQNNTPREERCLEEYQKEFCYRCAEPNVAVLDRAEIYLEGQLLTEDKEILRGDRILRDALGMAYRGGEMMQPWYVRKYRPQVLENRKNVKTVFHFYVMDLEDLPMKMALAVEYTQAGLENTEIYVNGQKLLPEKEFWIDPVFRKCKVRREMLKTGRNDVSLEYSYGQDNGLEAVYLLGDFGVKLIPDNREQAGGFEYESEDGSKEERAERIYLTGMPEKLTGASITKQGFPFYSGSMTYLLDDETRGKLSGETEVEYSNMPAALSVLHGAGDARIFCAPYRVKIRDLCSIEMIFTRRNTFGPLHLPVKYRGNYGPETFLTKGEEWKENLQLIEQGLPEVITLHREW